MKTLITLFFCLFLFEAFAQPSQKTFYLKFDGQIVSTLDSADYIRYIQEPKKGEQLFDLIETYKDGRKKRIGKLKYYEPYLHFENKSISYFKNGKIESVENYSHGRPYSENFYYYPNGKVKEILNYYYKERQLNVKTKLLADTSGISLLDKKASGKFILNDFNGVSTNGIYHKGKKSGAWEIKNPSSKNAYKEKYKKGTLVLGTLINSLGKETTYKYLKTKPTFKDKEIEYKLEDELISYYSNIDLKRKSLDKNKGGVTLLFDITEDGKPVNVKVYQSLTPPNDAHAINEIKSRNWTPAKHRGIPAYFSNYIYKIYYN